MDKIRIPGVNHILILPANNITRVEAQGNYCSIFLADGSKLFYAKVLRWFEQRLPQTKFIRVNRGQLINKDFISESWSAGNQLIEMQNGDCILISRRRKNQTQQAIAP